MHEKHTDKDSNPKVTIEDRDKVLALLESVDRDKRLKFVTGGVSYTSDEVIEHVRNLDSMGLDFVKTQMDFERDLKSGEVDRILASIEKDDE